MYVCCAETYRDLLSGSTTDGHLGCFYFWARNNLNLAFFGAHIHAIRCIHSSGIARPSAIQMSGFSQECQQFSKVALPSYTSTSTIGVVQLVRSGFSSFVILLGMLCYFVVVLICTSPISKGDESH